MFIDLILFSAKNNFKIIIFLLKVNESTFRVSLSDVFFNEMKIKGGLQFQDIRSRAIPSFIE